MRYRHTGVPYRGKGAPVQGPGHANQPESKERDLHSKQISIDGAALRWIENSRSYCKTNQDKRLGGEDQYTASRAPGPKQAREHRQQLPDRHARTLNQAAARTDPATKQSKATAREPQQAHDHAQSHSPHPQQTGARASRKPGHTGSSQPTSTTKQTSYRTGTTAGAQTNAGAHAQHATKPGQHTSRAAPRAPATTPRPRPLAAAAPGRAGTREGHRLPPIPAPRRGRPHGGTSGSECTQCHDSTPRTDHSHPTAPAAGPPRR